MEDALVSVVVPAFNQAQFLGDCLKSVLAQTHSRLEVIVVDNGSTDDPGAVAAQFPEVRFLRRDANEGPSAARNAGSEAATGTIIAYVDADDLLKPACIETRLKLLLSLDDPGLVVGNLDIVDEQGNFVRSQGVLPGEQVQYDFWTALKVMNCPTCGLLITKEALDVSGGWDEEYWIAEDTDLLLRVSSQFDCAVDSNPLASYRQVSGSLSKEPRVMFDAYAHMLAKNVTLVEDKRRYIAEADRSFRDRMVNNIFGNILKDGRPQKFGRMLKIMRERPRMIQFFFYWMLRIATNRLWKKRS